MIGLHGCSPFLLPSLLLLLLPSFPLVATSASELLQGQSLADGGAAQTLISPGEIFELGFFSIGTRRNTGGRRYLGIYYHNISTQSIIWIANRDSPLQGSSGILSLGIDGNLSLLDGATTRNSLWSTNTSGGTSSSISVSLMLLDSGRLVLQLSNGTVAWDSFDHPTDTFLPGMRVSLNKRTGMRTLFRSWRSADDPSTGNYSLGLHSSGQLFIWEGDGKPRWRSGEWDGTSFIGSTMRPLYLYGFHPTNDVENGLMYFTYTQLNNSLLRFVLQWNGVENTSILVEDTKQWSSVWVQPVNDCEIYGNCGAFGICSRGSSQICSCLKGFEPKNSVDWGNGNWSGGCVRKTALACEVNGSRGGTEDGFFKVEGVKVPDHSIWASLVRNGEDCHKFCMNNCSCKAYAYVSGIGCLTWDLTLVDTYEFSVDDNENGNDLYIKLAGSELGTESKIWRIIVIVLAIAILVAVIFAIVLLKYHVKIKDWWKNYRKRETSFHSLTSKRIGTIEISGPSRCVEEGLDAKNTELSLYSMESIAMATGDFSISNKLGEGGFGHVYKGLLPDGNEIAVKRLSRSSGQGQQEFKNEMTLIAKLQHRNLVKLIGCCIHGEERMLIYEYMPNKSLDAFIFDADKQASLGWSQRFDIIEGIARGLVYLHQDSRLRIIHRDLKASNVLLDEMMKPKISDFGMAKIFGNEQNQDSTERVVGTYGYMAPEYGMEGLFSVKSDVYSFGILVLEIISGRRNSSFRHMENSTNIVGYAWKLWNEDKAMELIDPSLGGTMPTHQVLRCIQVGLLCVQDRAIDRPDMPSVLVMLGCRRSDLPMPKKPTFTSEETQYGTHPREDEIYYPNDMTITMLTGR